MGERYKAKACIFCGDRDMTDEHFLSRKWLERMMPSTEKFSHHQERSGESVFDRWWKAREASFVVTCVCTGCNSGWMNAMDERAHPLAEPLVAGLPVKMTDAESIELLASWSTKISMMADYRQERPTIPATHHAHFYEHKTPPETWHLRIASLDLPFGEWLAWAQAGSLNIAVGGADGANAYRAAFGVNHFVLQAFVPFGVESMAPLHRGFAEHAKDLWPPTFQPLILPPPRLLGKDDLDDFRDAFLS